MRASQGPPRTGRPTWEQRRSWAALGQAQRRARGRKKQVWRRRVESALGAKGKLLPRAGGPPGGDQHVPKLCKGQLGEETGGLSPSCWAGGQGGSLCRPRPGCGRPPSVGQAVPTVCGWQSRAAALGSRRGDNMQPCAGIWSDPVCSAGSIRVSALSNGCPVGCFRQLLP